MKALVQAFLFPWSQPRGPGLRPSTRRVDKPRKHGLITTPSQGVPGLVRACAGTVDGFLLESHQASTLVQEQLGAPLVLRQRQRGGSRLPGNRARARAAGTAAHKLEAWADDPEVASA